MFWLSGQQHEYYDYEFYYQSIVGIATDSTAASKDAMKLFGQVSPRALGDFKEFLASGRCKQELKKKSGNVALRRPEGTYSLGGSSACFVRCRNGAGPQWMGPTYLGSPGAKRDRRTLLCSFTTIPGSAAAFL